MTLWGKGSEEYPIFRYRTTPREDLSAVTLLPANYETVIDDALTKRLANTPTPMSSACQRDRFFSPERPMAESAARSKTPNKKEDEGLSL